MPVRRSRRIRFGAIAMDSSSLRKQVPVSALLDSKIVMPAIGSAFVKLDPRTLIKNPVMFVLEVVTALTTIILIRDLVLVEARDLIPSDGEVIEGMASVNEAAITGESAPVIRESGGDRSAVTGGTQVLSDWIRVRITAAPGSTFLDRMIRLV